MPKYFGLGSDDPTEESERRTADALRNLGPDWIVIHHVTWQSKRNGRQGDGEADFVVLHPELGGLVLEVKGGGVDLVNGRWRSTDRYGQVHDIKNPYEQALSSKHALLAWLKSQDADWVRLGHAVVFSHLSEVPNLGPAAIPEITFTRKNFATIEAGLVACMKHWELNNRLPKIKMEILVGLLAPTVVVRRPLIEQSADAEASLIELTAEQIEAFAGLRSNRGGLIFGNAGTGKTVLAISRAQQLQRDGFRTLLVCYNEILGQELSHRLGSVPGLTACTFHALCFKLASEAGLVIPQMRDQQWWEVQAPELILEACLKTEVSFDAIVVDEAQDFAPSWLEALRCLSGSRADAPFFAFADLKQDLWRRSWLTQTEFPIAFELTRNLRNTHPIAEKVAAVIGTEVRPPRGVEGPPPKWREARNSKRLDIDVIAVVEKLIDEGFGPNSLVVLCSSHALVQILREHSVGPYSFGRWGGRGIPVETIARFKGMESEAIVLALDDGESEIDQTSAYVGLSRPRSVLVVIGSQKKQASLNWIRRKS